MRAHQLGEGDVYWRVRGARGGGLRRAAQHRAGKDGIECISVGLGLAVFEAPVFRCRDLGVVQGLQLCAQQVAPSAGPHVCDVRLAFLDLQLELVQAALLEDDRAGRGESLLHRVHQVEFTIGDARQSVRCACEVATTDDGLQFLQQQRLRGRVRQPPTKAAGNTGRRQRRKLGQVVAKR